MTPNSFGGFHVGGDDMGGKPSKGTRKDRRLKRNKRKLGKRVK